MHLISINCSFMLLPFWAEIKVLFPTLMHNNREIVELFPLFCSSDLLLLEFRTDHYLSNNHFQIKWIAYQMLLTVVQHILSTLRNAKDVASCNCVSKKWKDSMPYIRSIYLQRSIFEHLSNGQTPDNIITKILSSISRLQPTSWSSEIAEAGPGKMFLLSWPKAKSSLMVPCLGAEATTGKLVSVSSTSLKFITMISVQIFWNCTCF